MYPPLDVKVISLKQTFLFEMEQSLLRKEKILSQIKVWDENPKIGVESFPNKV